MSGHVAFSKDKEPYVVWFIICRFDDGERSINAYWRGIAGIRSFGQLKGKSIVLTMGENPNEEDFGYYYNSHKGLHWLQIDLLDIVDKEIHVCIRAHRNTEDDELEEGDESRYTFIEGNFKISFEGIHIREHDYPGSLNFLDHSEMKEIVGEVVDIKDFNGPYYSFGDPYSKKGSCLFEWSN
ncbi:hypothetical protein CPBP_00761 [Candidatus Bodocaedibacter vickermanii]|uniref:Uncharacterized protein n=2 Tax=Candidatus Bodocaedibacter vickermanii TaxID=2741701 RepID=A0A7L9RTV0_9PROT|nr:hypothetical protein CPBP_00761 [Candidatus Paracaedibacteraceae bacterium 'Lake Konstanz']